MVHLPIQLANCKTIINGLSDSGAELTVLAKLQGMLPHEDLQLVGQVKLRGIFGDSADADLVLVRINEISGFPARL